MAVWAPSQYERFADQRNRPFFDLLGRVDAEKSSLVVDLGCGNGPLTLAAAQRWPGARVVGVDSSGDMLDRARDLDTDGRVEWVQADVARWDLTGAGAPDVIVSNATLQWVPGHLDLIPGWLDALRPGGWFAMQVPGNFRAPSHVAIREVAAAQPRGAELTAALRADPVAEPPAYAEVLASRCAHLDVWETTYLQVLDPAGEQDAPVLEWVKGTALRPLLDLLEGAEREAFLADLRDRLAHEYPRAAYGTPFPFRRIFAVGQVAA
ncbi:methyltransferase domain-containing protein [Luteipulveratus halotolerans]|uniref:Trans-aconitate methyltransferase n=1 Tax=Luteipulveratus halotolerans TaxID=1631356 RepID=A0A0L6CK79_9MICO|nr:methyltransferase domain-containing protein [Luteipulveratus halotolerans]KNX38015.1 trans-aconitate methyltransferase [Luteipulveratus halotolerans]